MRTEARVARALLFSCLMLAVVACNKGDSPSDAAPITAADAATRTALIQPPQVPDEAKAEMDPHVAEAIDSALAAVDETPGSWERWLDLGLEYAANDLPTQALPALQQASQLAPGEARPLYYLGRLQGEQGDPQAGIEALRQATTLAADYAPLWWRLGMLQIEADQWEDSGASFRKALELDPKAEAAWLGLGRYALWQDQPEEALTHFERALELSQENDQYIAQFLARTLQRLGRTEEAEAALAEVSRVGTPVWDDPWDDALLAHQRGLGPALERALRLIRRADAPAAIAALEQLRDDYPEEVPVLLNLGIAYGLAQRYDESQAVFADVLQRDPDNPEAHEQRARALAGKLMTATEPERSQLYDEAMAHLDQALAAKPEGDTSHALRADLLRMAGRIDEAAEAYATAGELSGAAHRWSMIAADMYMRAGRFEDAVGLLNALTSDLPEQQEAWRLLAAAQAELGRMDEATAALEQALALDPDDEVAQRLLERVRAVSGQTDGDG